MSFDSNQESQLSVIGKMPQTMAKLQFLAYEGLRAVVGSEDPHSNFSKGIFVQVESNVL